MTRRFSRQDISEMMDDLRAGAYGGRSFSALGPTTSIDWFAECFIDRLHSCWDAGPAEPSPQRERASVATQFACPGTFPLAAVNIRSTFASVLTLCLAAVVVFRPSTLIRYARRIFATTARARRTAHRGASPPYRPNHDDYWAAAESDAPLGWCFSCQVLSCNIECGIWLGLFGQYPPIPPPIFS